MTLTQMEKNRLKMVVLLIQMVQHYAFASKTDVIPAVFQTLNTSQTILSDHWDQNVALLKHNHA